MWSNVYHHAARRHRRHCRCLLLFGAVLMWMWSIPRINEFFHSIFKYIVKNHISSLYWLKRLLFLFFKYIDSLYFTARRSLTLYSKDWTEIHLKKKKMVRAHFCRHLSHFHSLSVDVHLLSEYSPNDSQECITRYRFCTLAKTHSIHLLEFSSSKP